MTIESVQAELKVIEGAIDAALRSQDFEGLQAYELQKVDKREELVFLLKGGSHD
jgi:hypothetical protein